MNNRVPIQYLQRADIDDNKWNECIDKAPNGLIYAYSSYLDHMAGNWDGLVLNDYEAVMPLPWRKKWGIRYLYQPSFTAQLGVFGLDITASLFERFLVNIPPDFRLWEISFNQGNVFKLDRFRLLERINCVLPLERPYEKLLAGYRENIRRNLKKSVQYGCHAKRAIGIEEIVPLALRQPHAVSENELEKFKKLYHLLKGQSAAETYGVFSKNEELLASCVFIFSHQRAYYILVGNHPNGRTLGASHALINAFIKDHAGQDLLLDFEGSDSPRLAFFYSSFGAREERYAAIRLNRLPWYIRWMKD